MPASNQDAGERDRDREKEGRDEPARATVVDEDRPLEVLQRLARLEPELHGERVSGALVGLKRLGLPA